MMRILIVSLLFLSGCTGVDPAGSADREVDQVGTSVEVVKVHTKAVREETDSIRGTSKDKSVVKSADKIDKHVDGIEAEVDKVDESAGRIEAKVEDLKEERDEAVEKLNSPMMSFYMWGIKGSSVVIALGLLFFFWKASEFGMWSAIVGAIMLGVFLTLMQYMAIVTVVLSVVIVVGFFGGGWVIYKKLKQKDKTNEELTVSYSHAYRMLPEYAKKKTKNVVRDVQSPETQMVVKKIKLNNPELIDTEVE